MGARELADGFATALREELDFRVEAANMAAVGAVSRDVVVPVPYPRLSTGRLLVMQRLEGIPLAEAGPAIAERAWTRPRWPVRCCTPCCGRWCWTGVPRRPAPRQRAAAGRRPAGAAGLRLGRPAVLARHLGPGGGAGVRMFADLVRIVAGFRLLVPPAVAAVFRALATAEGTLTGLAPGFDVVAESRRFAVARLAEQWRTASPRQLVTDELSP